MESLEVYAAGRFKQYQWCQKAVQRARGVAGDRLVRKSTDTIVQVVGPFCLVAYDPRYIIPSAVRDGNPGFIIAWYDEFHSDGTPIYWPFVILTKDEIIVPPFIPDEELANFRAQR